jgi:hypothetical protein
MKNATPLPHATRLPRTKQPKARPRRRPRTHAENGDAGASTSTKAGPQAESSFRSLLAPEFQNLTDAELLQKFKRKICALMGVHDAGLANRLLSQAIEVRRFGEPNVQWGEPDVDALAVIVEFASSNVLETMLAVQMFGVHEAALSFLQAAGQPGLGERQRDAELRRARELMQLFTSQLDRMRMLKDKGWGRKEDDT